MSYVASLPMYDFPEIRMETDALWRRLAEAMRSAGIGGVPDKLIHDAPPEEIWRRRDLLFSQACGYPLTHAYRHVLRPVATPRYRAPGCRGAEYSSAVLVPKGSPCSEVKDLRGSVCAVNSPVSQSGYSALRALVAPLSDNGRFFSNVRVSGGHLDSIDMVAGGAADVCAVDCVTHALARRYRPKAVAGLRVLTYTAGCPGLPFVTRAEIDDDLFRRLRAAVHEALADPGLARAREALLIDGLEELELEDYRMVLDLELRAAASGYAEMR